MKGRIFEVLDQDGNPLFKAEAIESNDNALYVRLIDGQYPEEGEDVRISLDGGDLMARIEDVEKKNITLRILEPFERRAFFRIDDTVQLKAKKVRGVRGFSRRFSLPGRPMAQEEDTAVGLLKAINEKLEFLIQHLILKEEGFFEGEVKRVNLSAGGMRFEFDEPVDVGDVLELKIILPAPQPVGLVLYGEVIRVNKKKDNSHEIYEAAVKFSAITEDVREEIIRYTLFKQRESLRKKGCE